MDAQNPFRYAADKLAEMAGPDLWPLAMIYFNAETKTIRVAVVAVGAELLVGHGKKIGLNLDTEARRLTATPKLTPPGPKRWA